MSYRGSLLNWCPVGRDSGDNERERFILEDRKKNIRIDCVSRLKEMLGEESDTIDIALGGDTSIDIYPKGWNKTYALRYYDNYKTIFVGDRCEKGGNDYHIYENLSKLGLAFKTKNPENTIDIIRKIIIPMVS